MSSWIMNYGKQPVNDDVAIEVYLRNGEKEKHFGSGYIWTLDNDPYDVLFYRETANLSLEDAYDEPPIETSKYTYAQALSNAEVETSILTKEEQAYYKAPETRKKIYVKKRSAEAIVADAFNQHNGTGLSEDDVMNIIDAVKTLQCMEK